MLNRQILLPKNKSFFLFGPRQTGKTTLLRDNFKHKSWTLNLLHNELFLNFLKNKLL